MAPRPSPFKKAVVKLEVAPQTTPEGNIILYLDVNKDSRGESTTQGVAIDTKHIKTQVLVENGGAPVVIGGIFEIGRNQPGKQGPRVRRSCLWWGNLFKNSTKDSMQAGNAGVYYSQGHYGSWACTLT